MRTAPAAALVGALVTSSFGALDARAQTIDPQKAQAWLESRYGIKSERVAEATPDELVVLRTIESRPPSDFRVVAHFESFAPPDPLDPPSSDREYLINCPSRRFHVDRIESFSENGSRGAQSTTFGPSTWGLAIPNSPDWRIIAAVCGPSDADIAAEAALQAERPPEPTPRAQAPPPEPPPPAPPPPVQKPAAPNAQPPKPPPVRSKAPAPKPSRRGPVRVQFFAGDRQAAERMAQMLPARLVAAGLLAEPEVVQASVRGRPIYRVQISGFTSTAEAVKFCASARAARMDCFVPSEALR